MITPMAYQDDIQAVLIDLLVSLEADPAVPISLYEIGPPMVDRGHTEEEILNGLFDLQGRKVIELLSGNRLRVREKLIAQPCSVRRSDGRWRTSDCKRHR